jgi:glutaredoxin
MFCSGLTEAGSPKPSWRSLCVSFPPLLRTNWLDPLEKLMEKFVIPHNQVLLFGLSYCSYCKATQKYLSRRLTNFIYVEMDTLEGDARAGALAAVSSLNPARSFPVIVFGDTGQILVGYDTILLNEKLEVMLANYPQLYKLPEEPEKHGPLYLLKQQVRRT